MSAAGKETPPSPSLLPPDPGFPIPTTFGVFALDGDRLVELKALQGRMPDARVAISAAITTPSDTHIASTRPRFIVFRRDLIASAPDAVQLRVAARVMRSGGPKRLPEDNASPGEGWVIRSIAIPYKVSPIPGRPEMILLQPEAEDLSLAGGRYALVIKGQGFDIAIDAPETDPAHCLQRFNATNGMFYAPCPDR